MRFEFAVALNYLIPSRKKASASIISLLSVVVVSLVVWLSVVFLSVLTGLESRWTEELVLPDAPIKITPSALYYNSYYYQHDKYSDSSSFLPKSIGEKLDSTFVYDVHDNDCPFLEGCFKDNRDIVKETFTSLSQGMPGKWEGNILEHKSSMAIVSAHAIEKCSVNDVFFIHSYDFQKNIHKKRIVAESSDMNQSNSIMLPKSFMNKGYSVCDELYLYSMHDILEGDEQPNIISKIVAFYDPGCSPMASKAILASRDIVDFLTITSDQDQHDIYSNGLSVFFGKKIRVDLAKSYIEGVLKENNLSDYWIVESFLDDARVRPVINQIKSDKTIFSMIAIIVMIVACSNILTMLLLLVNDKKKEVGILMAMGASRRSIAIIFGLCGACTGSIGAVMGVLFASFTLYNLNSVVNFLGWIQNQEAFQGALFGGSLPSSIDGRVIFATIVTTIIFSVLAGIIPAYKASRLDVSDILKS